jgi:hypothetical protein
MRDGQSGRHGGILFLTWMQWVPTVNWLVCVKPCVISCFFRNMRSAPFGDVMQRGLVAGYRSFGTACLSHLRGPHNCNISGIRNSYITTCLLLTSPWSGVLLEKLTNAQLLRKFPALYGTRMFITAFTCPSHEHYYYYYYYYYYYCHIVFFLPLFCCQHYLSETAIFSFFPLFQVLLSCVQSWSQQFSPVA